MCRCVVVEDSRIGLRAAKSAGMTCIVTKSSYTQNEDFTGADAVFDSLDAGEVTLAKLSELAAAATAANAAA
jgi:beta-phosphoglucomutase-like phosphatase (HAD superfamily)